MHALAISEFLTNIWFFHATDVQRIRLQQLLTKSTFTAKFRRRIRPYEVILCAAKRFGWQHREWLHFKLTHTPHTHKHITNAKLYIQSDNNNTIGMTAFKRMRLALDIGALTLPKLHFGQQAYPFVNKLIYFHSDGVKICPWCSFVQHLCGDQHAISSKHSPTGKYQSLNLQEWMLKITEHPSVPKLVCTYFPTFFTFTH